VRPSPPPLSQLPPPFPRERGDKRPGRPLRHHRFTAGSLAIALALSPLAAQEPPANPPQSETPPVRVLRTGGLKVESAALLVSGEQGGSIHVAVLPLFFPAAGGRVRVPVVLEIDGVPLLKGNTGNLLRVEIGLYALAANGAVQGSLLETIEADLSRVGTEIERSGLQYAGELALAPGDYSLRVLVRNALTSEVGLRFLPLAVPDPAAGPLLLPPVFPNPGPDAWVAALSKAARVSPAMLADGGLPAAQPVLGVGQEARFELPVWKARSVNELRVEVLRPDGGHVAELPVRILTRREAAGLDRITASFVPAGLEPGRYLIRAVLPRAEVPAWSSPFVLLATGGEGKPWAELLHGGQGAQRTATASQAPPVPSRGRRLDAGPVRDAYRRALQLLAAGDEAAARRAASELEASLLLSPKPAASEDLAEIELGVARDLAAVAPQSLIPIVILHTSLYRDAHERRDHLLATHAREMVLALANLYAERSGDAAGKRTAAHLVLALASQLIQGAPPGICERAFRQILTFDEEDETARLYLALDAERTGRYAEAVAQLERLLRSHPDSAEARVRLAVNLRRLGRTRDADRLLAGLLQGPDKTSEAWVLALAYHETGRALSSARRLDEAERVLREGLQRLPGDEKLLVELAAVFDLRHDPAQARQILTAFKPVRDGGDSARRRYGRPPAEALDRAWTELQRSLPERLPALAKTLEAPAPEKKRSGP